MDILIWGLLSVHGQCQVAKDARIFSSELVTVFVSTLIVPLKIPSLKLDKGFVIGGYFGMGTFEYFWAMPSGKRGSKLLL